ncbi:DEAD/DEAH box helicase [Paenibacillus piscarius]|uniref:DEAD/DEAH box helicase n=1 Tax=Paenibacillus piscarius TaxID=1089681 RepID=UPI001EE7895F
MKVAVYAVELSGEWVTRVSMNLEVDGWWWAGEGGDVEGWNSRRADRMVVLSRSMPLGWAVKLAGAGRFTAKTRSWNEEDWRKYATAILKAEVQAERKAGGQRGEGWPFEEIEVWRLAAGREHVGSPRLDGMGEKEPARVDGGTYKWTSTQREELKYTLHSLAAGADRLTEALAGRSLLAGEAEALVTEMLPELTDNWIAAAQLAYLQGRLQIEAAVGVGQSGQEQVESGRWDKRGRSVRTSEGRMSWERGESEPELSGGRGQGERGRWYKRGRSVGRSERRGNWERGDGVLARLRTALALRGAAARRAAAPRCLRCGSVPTGRTACAACGLAGCAYCEACLGLGRSRACALLLRSAPLPAVRCTAGASPTVAARRWGLSAAQAAAAAAALGFLAEPRQRSARGGPERFLLWAVTGAGKTEMIFPLLDSALAAGGRALIATPRRDVVLELAPRLAKAFPAHSPAVLYGGSEDRWRRSGLTLATTHQLLRFSQAFDLVIIDEIDAFPFHNDAMLDYAAKQVCKPGGAFILLSATPPAELQRLARAGRLPHARVPVRYHGHPLPVPRHIRMPPLHRCLRQGRLPGKLVTALQRSLKREAQIFVFVSRIAHIDELLQLLRHVFPGIAIEGTSSQDPARAEKVLDFRNRTISLLVTTTILERGVTVPRSDVYILDADSGLFDEAALVQMAGRAGRSSDDPAGQVIFASPEWSRSQRAAIAQIRRMNAIARRQGYLRSR